MRKARKAEDAKLKAEARTKAAAIWQAAQPAPDNHPYLVEKAIKPHGLRMHDGDLIVPMREGEDLHSLQFIKPDGTKLYLFGGRKRGCYCIIGELLSPLCIAEGFATAASVHEATGHAVAVAFDAGNLLPVARSFRARFPHLHLIICADDDVTTPGNPGMTKAEEAARAVGASLAVPDFGPDRPEDTSDFNDLRKHRGAEAVRACIDGAKGENIRSSNGAAPDATIDWPLPRPIAAELASVPQFELPPPSGQVRQHKVSVADTRQQKLEIGSDVEIARCVRKDLIECSGRIVHAEGAFWRYATTHWEEIPEHELRRSVHRYDGADVVTQAGRSSRIKLGKARIDSSLNECAALCADPHFFEKRPDGINCVSGFIRFAEGGTPTIDPHNRDHRCRHTLPGRWQSDNAGLPPARSLLSRLLKGVFRGDKDARKKIALLSEICGAAALGYGTKLLQPRAVILFGRTAENGKSQILDLVRGILPPNAICTIPAAKMADERHIIGLVGKHLNAADELSAAAIASDAFKAVVTGEMVDGRDVYKSRVEFRPVAQHLFATNELPPFKGGMDRGVQRRLLVVPFNRLIPIKGRIEEIGRKVASEEPDLLLAFAVSGAARLIRQRNFSIPVSCTQALREWIFGADPVLAWLDECTEVRPIIANQPALRTSDAYKKFQAWALAEKFKIEDQPGVNGFVQRILANAKGVEHFRTKSGRFFLGLVVVHPVSPNSSR